MQNVFLAKDYFISLDFGIESTIDRTLEGINRCHSHAETVKAFEVFFKEIGSPVRLSETDYGEYDREKILQLLIKQKAEGSHHKFSEQDHKQLLELMW